MYWYFFRFANRNMTEMIVENTSATVIAYQMPSTSKISGSRITDDVWKTSVRKKEIAAEIRPLFSAVKNEDAKILKPENRNANANSRNACRVSSYNPASYPTNSRASGAARC